MEEELALILDDTTCDIDMFIEEEYDVIDCGNVDTYMEEDLDLFTDPTIKMFCDVIDNPYCVSKYQHSEQLKYLAVYLDSMTVGVMHDPSLKVRLLAVRTCGLSIRGMIQTELLAIVAVYQNPNAIQHVLREFQTHKVIMIALTKDPTTIRFVYLQEMMYCKYVIGVDPEYISLIKKPTQEMWIEAITIKPLLIKRMRPQKYRVCMEAVVRDESCFNMIRSRRLRKKVSEMLDLTASLC